MLPEEAGVGLSPRAANAGSEWMRPCGGRTLTHRHRCVQTRVNNLYWINGGDVGIDAAYLESAVRQKHRQHKGSGPGQPSPGPLPPAFRQPITKHQLISATSCPNHDRLPYCWARLEHSRRIERFPDTFPIILPAGPSAPSGWQRRPPLGRNIGIGWRSHGAGVHPPFQQERTPAP